MSQQRNKYKTILIFFKGLKITSGKRGGFREQLKRVSLFLVAPTTCWIDLAI